MFLIHWRKYSHYLKVSLHYILTWIPLYQYPYRYSYSRIFVQRNTQSHRICAIPFLNNILHISEFVWNFHFFNIHKYPQINTSHLSSLNENNLKLSFSFTFKTVWMYSDNNMLLNTLIPPSETHPTMIK